MFRIIPTLRHYWQALRTAAQDTEFQILAALVIALLTMGTLFYHFIESWDWLDSLYFCVITLATVGYGDFTPQTTPGKLFTIIYIFMGVGLIVAVASRLAQSIVAVRGQYHKERVIRRLARRARGKAARRGQKGQKSDDTQS
jgi:hypothetical protein